MATTASEADEIRQLARTYQYDRYVSALLLPRQHREALIVLAAFAGELQRIPFVASESMIAAIRLQWWRDELLTAAGGESRRSGHQLCDMLVQTADTYTLPYGLLQGMIDATESELDPTPFNETAETRQVLTKFDGALFELAGRILGSQSPRDLWAEAAVAYGAAWLAAEHSWRARVGAQTYVSRASPDVQKALVRPAQDALNVVRSSELDAATKGALQPLATVEPLLRSVAIQLQQTDATHASLDDKGLGNNGLRDNGSSDIGLSNFTRARLLLWAHWRGRV